jgi:hypothetical protein
MGNQNVPAPAPNPNPAPVPTPGPMPIPIPGTPISIDPVALVNGILDCYKNVAIAKEEQLTLRTQIREQSRVCIAAIEANTKEFELALDQVKIERMEFVKLVCDTIRQDGVDEYSLKLCEKVLDYLTNTNPMNHAGKSLQFSNSISGMIGRRD